MFSHSLEKQFLDLRSPSSHIHTHTLTHNLPLPPTYVSSLFHTLNDSLTHTHTACHLSPLSFSSTPTHTPYTFTHSPLSFPHTHIHSNLLTLNQSFIFLNGIKERTRTFAKLLFLSLFPLQLQICPTTFNKGSCRQFLTSFNGKIYYFSFPFVAE